MIPYCPNKWSIIVIIVIIVVIIIIIVIIVVNKLAKLGDAIDPLLEMIPYCPNKWSIIVVIIVIVIIIRMDTVLIQSWIYTTISGTCPSENMKRCRPSLLAKI